MRAGAAAAVAAAAAAAGPGLQEPVMSVTISVAVSHGVQLQPLWLIPTAAVSQHVSGQEEFVGPVLTDLTAARRGLVGAVEDSASAGGSAASAGSRRVVQAEVPLAEMVTYATVLRSLTQGGGDFTMQVSRCRQSMRHRLRGLQLQSRVRVAVSHASTS